MKIVLLAAASSIHTVRWANGLSASGHQVHVISQHAVSEPFDPAVNLHRLPFRGRVGYFTSVWAVRKLLKQIKPDLVNAHYASGYGTTARLVGYHPWLLSVWGSDIYDFPHQSFLHKWLVVTNLRAADKVASTSHCMAKETLRLVPEIPEIAITPFGVDLNVYQKLTPILVRQKPMLVIDTVKTMSHKYGIDTLIEAYALLVKRLEQIPDHPAVVLRLIGGGEQTPELQALAERLGVANQTHFIGRIPHCQVPQELEQLDIYVALSRLDSESFGVAIIEASAAGRPVIVSNVGGLPEVTLNNTTGFIVPKESPQAAADALEKLVINAQLRHRMGQAGQQHVTQHYAWDTCIDTMLNLYEKIIKKA